MEGSYLQDQMGTNHLHATLRQKSPFTSSTKDVLRFREGSPASTRLLGVGGASAVKADRSTRKSLPKHPKGLQMLCIKQKRQNTSADKGSEATLKPRPNRSDSNSDSNAVQDSYVNRRLRSSHKLFLAFPPRNVVDRGLSPKQGSKDQQKLAVVMSHHDLLVDRGRGGSQGDRVSRADLPLGPILKGGVLAKNSASKAFLNSQLHLRRFLGRSPEVGDRSGHSSNLAAESQGSGQRKRVKKKKPQGVGRSQLKSTRSGSPRSP